MSQGPIQLADRGRPRFRGSAVRGLLIACASGIRCSIDGQRITVDGGRSGEHRLSRQHVDEHVELEGHRPGAVPGVDVDSHVGVAGEEAAAVVR
jgi:hypothetical protein